MDYEGDGGGQGGDGDGGGDPQSLIFVVRLACSYWQTVDFSYATADASADEGEDYLAELGSLSLPPGDVLTGVAVEIIGDEVDEGHEAMRLLLSGQAPEEVALVDGEGLGIIINDDFCQQSSVWWSRRPASWPATELVIGGIRYGEVELAYFLDYGGPDEPSRLARELVAAHFNLLIGSDPSILPVVEASDAFLAAHPPETGDQLDAGERATARDLLRALEDYQKRGCPR